MFVDESAKEFGVNPARDVMSRIAEILNVPASAFCDPMLMPAEIAGVAELMRLYSSLRSEPARAVVLAAARTAVTMKADG